MSYNRVALKLSSSFIVAALLSQLIVAQLSAKADNIGSSNRACNAKIAGGDKYRILCVCKEGSCPPLKFDWPQISNEAVVITSSRAGRRFDSRPLSEVINEDLRVSDTIKVDLSANFQTILGWGGAFTDAATININNLSESLANELIDSYYGIDGLQYNFGRVPLGGSDFSVRAYSYDDSATPDYDLKNWSLQEEDIKHKIPTILRAREAAERVGNGFKLFASPWSPPAWMKDNNNIIRGHLKDDDRVYESYARYLIKFYNAYKSHKVEFWGATLQNEPIAANMITYYFNSLQFGNQQMIKFISKHLGPALEANGYNKTNFKLMIGDDSLGLINGQVPEVLNDPEVQKYVAGLAFHWYASGTVVSYDSLNQVVKKIGDKIEFVMMTEACTGFLPTDTHVLPGSWERGESYASDIMEDLHRHTGAWIDWNLALNMQGGPNWVSNFVDSPILVDASKNEFYKQPMYYALAHFSRFLRPDSIRVGTKASSVRATFRSRIMAVATICKQSGHISMTILNKSDVDRNVEVSISGSNDVETKIPNFKLSLERRSITSIVIKV